MSDDVANDPALTEIDRRHLAAMRFGALIAAPVRRDASHPIWGIVAVMAEPRRWTDGEIAMVEETTERTWAAVERARAEAALRASEQQLRDTLDSMSEGFALFDPDFTILDVNAQTLRLDGRSRNELIGRNHWEAFPGSEDSPLGEAFKRFMRDRIPEALEHLYSWPDGRTMWVDTRAYTTTHGNIAIQWRDIIDRKRAEQALRDSEQALAFDIAHAERLRSLSERLELEEDFQAIYDKILSAVVEITQADAGTIQTYDPPTQSLELIASRNFTPAITDYFHRVDAGSRTACGIALKTGERALVNFSDAGEDVGCQRLIEAGIRSALAILLMSRTGSPLGMLNAHWRQAKHRPNDRELRFLDLLARKAADLIEQRRGQSALRQSEERFGALAEAIEHVFYVTDPDRNTLVYLSPGFERIWGRSSAALEVDLASFVETIHPEDRRRVAEGKAAQDRGGRVEIEYRVVSPDGGVRWVLDRCFPIADASGRRSAGVASDITRRRHAEERLRGSEERFRLLVESVHDYAIFTIDRDGIVTSWPAGAVAVFGWSEAEMLGRSVDLTFTPEDVAAGVPQRERETAARDGLARNVRWHLRNDESRIFIDGSTQPLVSADGEIREFIKIGQDVTKVRRVQDALTESEQRLRTLAEGIPQLVWRSADGGHWSWSSPQWQAYSGQSLGRGWLAAIHPDDRHAAMAAWEKAASNGGIDVEYRVRRASDGEHIWHHTRAVPVRDRGGHVVEWLGTTTDVQQLKELQKREEVMV